MALKIVFAGTPEFAIPTLRALLNSSHQVCAVYTKPDSPSGRGLKMSFSPVKQFVLDNYPSLPIIQPISLKDPTIQQQLSDYSADIMVVIAYGLILPPSVFSLFRYGCVNIHASLLPRWRGAAPIQRAILAGDEKTGITIMQMDAGLDTGQILKITEYAIQPRDTSKEVQAILAVMGSQTLLETLSLIEAGEMKAEPQEDQFAIYAAKILKSEAEIDWQNSAVNIDRKIRAFNPWPIAHTKLNEQLLKIWEAEVISDDESIYPAGQVLNYSEQGIDVATGQGILRLLKVQLSGGKPTTVKSFLQARSKLIILKQTRLG